MNRRECIVSGCPRFISDSGLCRHHYRLRLHGVPVIPCPVCGESMRTPADRCGWCVDEARSAA